MKRKKSQSLDIDQQQGMETQNKNKKQNMFGNAFVNDQNKQKQNISSLFQNTSTLQSAPIPYKSEMEKSFSISFSGV